MESFKIVGEARSSNETIARHVSFCRQSSVGRLLGGSDFHMLAIKTAEETSIYFTGLLKRSWFMDLTDH